jgi:hypothetical protein
MQADVTASAVLKAALNADAAGSSAATRPAGLDVGNCAMLNPVCFNCKMAAALAQYVACILLQLYKAICAAY